jgi:hypothetical protein
MNPSASMVVIPEPPPCQHSVRQIGVGV